MIEKYAFIALSHCEGSDGLAENGARRAVLISAVDVVVVGCVDMGFKGLAGPTGGAGVGVTMVAGLINIGTWGKGLLVS